MGAANMSSKKAFLRLSAVIDRTGLGRTSIYRGIAAGTFPAPVRLGPRAVGWPEDAIDRWAESRPSARAA
jgi:prophage regulatory protein